MTYYSKNKYAITAHALVRIKQRLNLTGDDVSITTKINEIIINECICEFDDYAYWYFRIPKLYSHYFVISKSQNIITTFTKISDQKKISLLSKK